MVHAITGRHQKERKELTRLCKRKIVGGYNKRLRVFFSFGVYKQK
jgi:hypothetical protein